MLSWLSKILYLLSATGLVAQTLVSSPTPVKDLPISPAINKVESIPGEILVKFKAGVDEVSKSNIRQGFGMTKKGEVAKIEVEVEQVPEKAKERVLAALKRNPRVKFAEPNNVNHATFTANDTLFSRQWNLNSTKLNTLAAWDISQGSSSVLIAIPDSGVNINHEDLVGKVTGDLDDYGHGTLLAGVIGAITNNTLGMSGICPFCQMLSLKMINSTGSGSTSASAAAIVSAADAGAKVINMSYGCYCVAGTDQTESDAIQYAWNKGAVLVGAAGNDNTTTILYPAGFTNVIDVGGTTSSDAKVSTSNYGPRIDVVAPGQGVVATTMGGSYTLASGTSLAAPHVSALAGLIFSANPKLTNSQVVDIIKTTAIDLGTVGKDDIYGYGRIDAYRALQKATGLNPNPDNQPPQVNISSPANGATISGLTDITVNATDNVGVTKVELYLINTPVLATFTTAPYTYSLDTTKYANGTSLTFYAKAYDGSGLVGTSSYSTFTVNQTVTTDTTAPVASITSPSPGATISGPANVAANATDNVGLSSISIFVDGSVVTSCTASGTSSSCSYALDSKILTNGSHNLQSKVLDSSNNLGQSSLLTVNVDNSTPTADTQAPTVSISSPSSGSTVSGTISFSADATDNVGVSKVEFYIDSVLKVTDNATPYTASIDTTALSNASHILGAKAYDAAGNTGSASVTITVNNSIAPTPPSSDTTSPSISIIAPADGSAVTTKSKVVITATSSDNVGVSKVEFYVAGTLLCTITAGPYSCSWPVPGKKNAQYTLSAKAYDAAGNTSSVSVVVSTK